METILIQIASYRDWELVNTIESAIDKASNADRLRFAIVVQDAPDNFSKLDKYIQDPRFKIKFQSWREARGVGLARFQTDEMYQGEDFYFQIDAHMRFKEGWDSALIHEWKLLNDPNAILSSYPPAYRYDKNGEEEYISSNPNRLIVHDMFMETIPVFFGHAIPDPVIGTRGAFVAGGMQFGPGLVCQKVPYEKEISFIGEEVVHSLRLYRAGYRIYTPINQVVYHLYLRSENQEESHHFWVDFLEDEELRPIYQAMNTKSYRTVMSHLEGRHEVEPEIVRQFENFAGVDFKTQKVHPDTYEVPPLPMSDNDEWRKESIAAKKQN